MKQEMKNKKIYILHGWTYSTDKWEPFLDELRGGGFDPVVLKIPGLTAPIDRVWTIDDYVGWLEKAIGSEKEKIILLGHSNGGLISLAYTLKHPDKVKRIFLIDSTGIYHKEVLLRIKRSIFMIAAKIGKKITKSFLAKKLIYKLARVHDYENADPIMRKTMINLINTDLEDRFDEIAVPVTIMWGKNDTVTPLKDGVVMRDKMKSAKLHIINGARHSPQLTHPKETAEIIINNL